MRHHHGLSAGIISYNDELLAISQSALLARLEGVIMGTVLCYMLICRVCTRPDTRLTLSRVQHSTDSAISKCQLRKTSV